MSRRDARRAGPTALYWCCLVLSTAGFLLPIDGAVADSVLELDSWFVVPVDKAVHAVLFALLVVLAGCARGAAGEQLLSSGLAVVAAGHLLYAVAIEACQHVLPWRSFETTDVMADALGIALGTLLVIVVRGRRRRSLAAEP